MAILRLTNGSDVTVKGGVADAMAAIDITRDGGAEFVEFETDSGGPIHIRPASVIAVLEDATRRASGFRVAEG